MQIRESWIVVSDFWIPLYMYVQLSNHEIRTIFIQILSFFFYYHKHCVEGLNVTTLVDTRLSRNTIWSISMFSLFHWSKTGHEYFLLTIYNIIFILCIIMQGYFSDSECSDCPYNVIAEPTVNRTEVNLGCKYHHVCLRMCVCVLFMKSTLDFWLTLHPIPLPNVHPVSCCCWNSLLSAESFEQ